MQQARREAVASTQGALEALNRQTKRRCKRPIARSMLSDGTHAAAFPN